MLVKTQIKKVTDSSIVLLTITPGCKVWIMPLKKQNIESLPDGSMLDISFGVVISGGIEMAHKDEEYQPVWYAHKSGDRVIQIDATRDRSGGIFAENPKEFKIILPPGIAISIDPE